MANASKKNQAQARAGKKATPQVSNEATKKALGTAPLGAKGKAAPIEEVDLIEGVNMDADTPVKVAKTPAPKPAKPAETPENAMARLKKDPATKARWAKVVRVTEMGKSGPTRVVIKCQDPQTKQSEGGEQKSVCEGEREIAIQDLFQVECCKPCQERKVRKARRESQKKRNRQMRAQIDALKGGK